LEKSFDNIEDFLSDPTFKHWVLKKDPESGVYWKEWIKRHPEREAIYLAAERLLLNMVPDPGDWENSSKGLLEARIYSSIHNQAAKTPNNFKLSFPRASHFLLSFLICLGLALITTELDLIPKFGKSASDEESTTVKWVTKATLPGQKSKVHLSDGSTVMLNAASEIKYREGFGISHRDICLSGEAFFEIAKNDTLAFNVYVDDVVTTALGTSFNINSYDRASVLVQLATGKVKVRSLSTEQEFPLEPGEQVTLSKDQLLKSNFNLATSFLWKDGILLFEKMPLSKVIKELERWYGREISLSGVNGKDPLVTGRFENDYLSNVLETISFSVPLTYKIEEKQIFVHLKTR
jgi:transmembrane sensor